MLLQGQMREGIDERIDRVGCTICYRISGRAGHRAWLQMAICWKCCLPVECCSAWSGSMDSWWLHDLRTSCWSLHELQGSCWAATDWQGGPSGGDLLQDRMAACVPFSELLSAIMCATSDSDDQYTKRSQASFGLLLRQRCLSTFESKAMITQEMAHVLHA